MVFRGTWAFPFIVCVIFLKKPMIMGDLGYLTEMHYVIAIANHHTDVHTLPNKYLGSMLPGPVLIMTLRLQKVKSHLPQSQPTCHPRPYHNRSRWKWCIFPPVFLLLLHPGRPGRRHKNKTSRHVRQLNWNAKKLRRCVCVCVFF